MIKNEYVNINITKTKYWIDKGYLIDTWIDTRGVERVKKGTSIEVKIEDLPHGSHTEIDIICDYCGKEYSTIYKTIIKGRKEIPKDACVECQKYKRQDVMQFRYGVKNALHSDIFKDKMKNTNLNKYGYEIVFENDDIKNKIINTNLIKYGVPYTTMSDNMKEKSIQTCIDRYGVPNASVLDEVKEKVRNTNLNKYGKDYFTQTDEYAEKTMATCLEKYGVEYIFQIPEVREKIAVSLYKSGGKASSKQQRYLCELFKGELNYPVSYYCVDIALIEERIAIEYNGGGHNLSVILGNMTQKEFNKKEYYRNKIILDNGWKMVTIISNKDKLLTDEEFLFLLDYSINYLNTGRHWTEINIDDGLWKSSQQTIELNTII